MESQLRGPVLLVSAGIGITPAARSPRDIWWLHGARGPREHPFAAEAHASPGHLTREALAGLAVAPNASAYVCGPASFMDDLGDTLPFGLVQVVGGEQDRGLLQIGQPVDDVVEVAPGLGVETGRRLVQEQQLGPDRGRPAPHPYREK